MAWNIVTQKKSPVASLPVRFLLMLVVLGGLIVSSTQTRRLPPGNRLTILVNLLFFVVLGGIDESMLAPALNRWPLARAAVLAGETLTLGWFFSPGRDKPASKTLYYVHVGPFFLAVLGGAAGVAALRQWRS